MKDIIFLKPQKWYMQNAWKKVSKTLRKEKGNVLAVIVPWAEEPGWSNPNTCSCTQAMWNVLTLGLNPMPLIPLTARIKDMSWAAHNSSNTQSKGNRDFGSVRVLPHADKPTSLQLPLKPPLGLQAYVTKLGKQFAVFSSI